MKQQAYLFVHFKEKSTPDGEQVYFGLSKDGFHWETVNGGNPVLWSYYGDKGVRDFTIIRCERMNKFYIFATDLSLSYGMRSQYHNSWDEIGRNGSKYFSVWESENLVEWSEQKLVKLGTEELGCLWAPDIIYDEENDEYVIHWSSSHKEDGYKHKSIYFSRTKDFENFTEPGILYRKENSGVIDSAIYKEYGIYYMFLKSEADPAGIMLLKSPHIEGPYENVKEFDSSMEVLKRGVYEAPTAVQLADGRWCLFLDYYGVSGAGQGYVPFITTELKTGRFIRADKEFDFPYGFKHGTILTISMDEYKRIKNYSWE
ncbi:glycoside hydrolase family 43 protein [Novisyntrophococcus fermenticellae]|uniref:glycoside hydrolase family 43 protein n=1 Tax=Novisyntrophococcus fermenticellae TaxID=2068655 RepID=UPI001E5BBC4E|nr:glycoside hydrolase family 43 protein [Novisyntrophococcus fermenticellae]